ncbi:hypothetical protein [Gorillibacterium massiliense]|uniref:hypothetical protein n=1 Tax=Gorillibacterium massiliense TaxID=1280390 RepID=UPI0004B48105|nr:hypothetical protein [Gorillibacterium massiliense]
MHNSLEIPHLLERRKILYEQLLKNADQQVGLLNQLEDDEFRTAYTRAATEWKVLVQELEAVQFQLGEREVPDSKLHDSSLLPILEEIHLRLGQIQSRISSEQAALQTDQTEVRNQHKILNAYYGVANRDLTALYFDEKK